MGNISAEEKALRAVALFEKHGRSVSSVTIKGKEIKFNFQEEAEAANSMDNREWKRK